MRSRPVPEPPVLHTGPRGMTQPANLILAIRKLARKVDDLGRQRAVQSLTPVDSAVANGKACTAAVMTSLYRMWTYRTGAAVYADVAAGCGTGSVIAAQLTCPDLTAAGTPVTSAAGGEQVLRVMLQMPAAWPTGDTHYVYVQAYRVSGTDATTLQVIRAWQR